MSLTWRRVSSQADPKPRRKKRRCILFLSSAKEAEHYKSLALGWQDASCVLRPGISKSEEYPATDDESQQLQLEGRRPADMRTNRFADTSSPQPAFILGTMPSCHGRLTTSQKQSPTNKAKQYWEGMHCYTHQHCRGSNFINGPVSMCTTHMWTSEAYPQFVSKLVNC